MKLSSRHSHFYFLLICQSSFPICRTFDLLIMEHFDALRTYDLKFGHEVILVETWPIPL
jgi:hypothetical protein